VRDQLQRAGFAVTLTRNADSYLDLESRPALANRRKADLFLSLHFNASPSSRGTVRGCEVYSLTPAGAQSTNVRGPAGSRAAVTGNGSNDRNILLAYHLQKALVRSLGVPDRGVRRARFAVLRDASMPAALIEAGFMSHPVEGKKIFSAAYRGQIARAIVEGVLAYKKAMER
jgi:N-acetylmuramoyl-L-alanine amidase